ncbi:hypothetical protein Baya_6845 [Bagarius yarrelli]|uniref:Uncharacterized protein n=1 Tax=Bagarius yarrelli TaxID=175774 RepID=A0A556TYZ0_BAGYA|nr:hypothetical protein Baya_6845 [Bagarius yarrelli]
MQEWEPLRHFRCHGTPPQTTVAATQCTGASSLAKAFLPEKTFPMSRRPDVGSSCALGVYWRQAPCGVLWKLLETCLEDVDHC